MEPIYYNDFNNDLEQAWVDGNSIHMKRVVDFDLIDGKLDIQEQCDQYYSLRLDKPNAQLLVDNLQELVNRMAD